MVATLDRKERLRSLAIAGATGRGVMFTPGAPASRVIFRYKLFVVVLGYYLGPMDHVTVYTQKGRARPL